MEAYVVIENCAGDELDFHSVHWSMESAEAEIATWRSSKGHVEKVEIKGTSPRYNIDTENFDLIESGEMVKASAPEYVGDGKYVQYLDVPKERLGMVHVIDQVKMGKRIVELEKELDDLKATIAEAGQEVQESRYYTDEMKIERFEVFYDSVYKAVGGWEELT